MVNFGVHVFSWPEEAEVVAAERIRAGSGKRLLGSCFPARDAWYHRKCLSRVYFLSPLVLIACVAMLRTKLVPAINLHLYASTFEGTTCTTSAANLTDLQLACDCRKSSKDKSQCRRQYPCLQLSVTLETRKGLKMTTSLYEDIEAMAAKYHDCAVFTVQCRKHDPADTVASLHEHYGTEGTAFNCLYNPDEPSEVLLHLVDFPGSFWAMLVTVVVFLAVSVSAPVIAYLTCGCMYVCTRSPPPDIQTEVERRAAEGDPLTTPPGDTPGQQTQSPVSPTPPPPYRVVVDSLPRYQSLNRTSTLSEGGATVVPHMVPGDHVVPVCQSPTQAQSPRAVTPHQASAGSTQQLLQTPVGAAETGTLQGTPVAILYVHPGGIISSVPPPGVAPVNFNHSPCPSPSAVPQHALLTKDGKDLRDSMFYQ